MLKILNKINGINNVKENNNLLQIEFNKTNILKIFNQLKDNADLNFNHIKLSFKFIFSSNFFL